MANDEAILAHWGAWLRASGSSAKSIRERTIVVRSVTRRTGRSLLELQRVDLVVDLGREGLAPSTRANYKSTFYGFFSWLQEEGLRADNPAVRLPRVRVPRSEPDPITTEQLQQLLGGGMYARARLWVLLYAYQGFRAQEIAAVSGESIDWDRRRILSRDGKAGVEVWRPIHPIVWDELQKWRRPGWLFPAIRRADGTHVAASTVSDTLSTAMKRAGIPHRPHQLRAWFATELIDAGVPTLIVARAMRHADEQSVGKYARVKDPAIEAAILKLPIVRVPDRSGRKVA
jgi:integrase/recombinase XerD